VILGDDCVKFTNLLSFETYYFQWLAVNFASIVSDE